jgi:DNA-binding SARP family transcriptional activator
MTGQGVSRTRLLPPQLPAGVIPRAELAERLAEGFRGRLVALIAGAGYGKTTLLRLALNRIEWPWIWCSCDERLVDARLLLAHLATAVSDRFPGFDARFAWAGGGEQDVAEFSNEVVETVPESFVIALDDVHRLPQAAAGALGPLLEQLPPTVHVAMAGRAPLPFGVGRLRLESMIEVDERQLALSLAETRKLIDAMGVGLDEVSLTRLHERSEGWPAGIILAAQSGLLHMDRAVNRAEFDYLAEEVMAMQPSGIQEFLLHTAVLGRFSPHLAAAVTGRVDADRVVRGLAEGHLFTVKLDEAGEWYRYHHLFQEFLRRKLRDLGPERAAGLHARAADWWLSEGEVVEAVNHLLAADDQERAIQVLEPVAERLALSPHAQTLSGWLAVLPRARWGERPGMLLAEAALLFASARHEAAFADSERAIARLVEVGDHERAAAALFRLQQAMLTAGTAPARRIEVGARWRGQITATSRLLPAARILLASGLAYGCRFQEAEEELAAALALPAAQRSPVLALYAEIIGAFYVDFWRGNPFDALSRLEEAQRRLQAREEADELGFLPFAEMLRCYLLNELGRHEDALAAAAILQNDLDQRGLGRVIRRSRIWVEATALSSLGRWDQLRTVLQAPPAAAEDGAPTSYGYRYRASWALLSAHDGEVEEVRRQINAALQEMAAFGTAFDDASFLCTFSLAAAGVGLDSLARELSREAIAAAGALGSTWARACASVVAAHCHQDDAAASQDFLAQALTITGRSGFDSLWSRRYPALAAKLLTGALAVDIGPRGEAGRILAGCGARVFSHALTLADEQPSTVRRRLAVAAADVPDIDITLLDRLLRDRDPGVRDEARKTWGRLKNRPRAEIRLVTLGELVVERDGIRVPNAAFVRHKARMLLAALVAARAPVHRETLCEWLWPELSPERAAAALRSTLHDLRRAVTPELASGDPSSLVVAEGETVCLVLAQRDSWDGGELVRMARNPPDNRVSAAELEDALARVEALYAGPFLAEWPYEDWAAGPRTEFEEAYKATVERLAAGLVARGRAVPAIGRYRRLLQMEPERESWHRDLMRAHAAAGERALALRQYHACRTVLRREQGIEPDAATRALYETLLREGAEAVTPP